MAGEQQTPYDPKIHEREKAQRDRQNLKKHNEAVNAAAVDSSKVKSPKEDTPATRAAAANQAHQQNERRESSQNNEEKKKSEYDPQFGGDHYQTNQAQKMLEELFRGLYNSLSPGKQAQSIKAQATRIKNMPGEFVKGVREFFGFAPKPKNDTGNKPDPKPNPNANPEKTDIEAEINQGKNAGAAMRDQQTPDAADNTKEEQEQNRPGPPPI